MSFRMYFVDDSGYSMTGVAVYAWVEVDAAHAADAMAVWLRFRQELYDRYGISVETEIHSVHFLSGRGCPRQDKWSRSKPVRREIFLEVLNAVTNLPGVSVGAVYRTTERRRDGFARVMHHVFNRLVLGVDRRLFLADLQGILVIDGDGTDGSYARACKALSLSGRHLIAEPFFQESHESQWIQIADVVAYSAYQAVVKQPQAEYCWTWYEDIIDPEGPRPV